MTQTLIRNLIFIDVTNGVISAFDKMIQAMAEIFNVQAHTVHTDDNPRSVEKESAYDETKPQSFDLLVIDDSKDWQEIIKETFDRNSCDVASSYDEAEYKIRTNHYKVVCLGEPFHTTYNWYKLIRMLKDNYPKLPVIITTTEQPEHIMNIQKKFMNVKGIINKGADFISTIKESVERLLSDKHQADIGHSSFLMR